jgi:hypothetical protein
MIAPRQVISNPNTAQMICDVLEGGLIVEDSELKSPNRQSVVASTSVIDTMDTRIQAGGRLTEVPEDEGSVRSTTSIGKKTSVFDLASNRRSVGKSRTSGMGPTSSSILKLLGFDHLSDLQVSTVVDEFEISGLDSSLIRETAENVLEHILNHCNNYPAPHGPELMSSAINDPAFIDDTAKEFDKYLYFTYNDSTIIALVEMPGSTPQSTRSRIIARNTSGKYVWDSSLFFESIERCQDISNNEQFSAKTNVAVEPQCSLGITEKFEFRGDVTILTPTSRTVDTPSGYTRAFGEMPEWSPACEGVDMLDQLLQ